MYFFVWKEVAVCRELGIKIASYITIALLDRSTAMGEEMNRKAFMAGGRCAVIPELAVSHVYRESCPYNATFFEHA